MINDNINEKQRRYVEAIKLAAGSLQYKKISVQQTFKEAIEQLFWYYEKLNNGEYLQTAILHIQAYLEMGFPYEANADLFNIVLETMGTTRDEEFPDKYYFSKQVKLNKTQVRGMIKKWPASPHQKMKINEVVDDIIMKVQNYEYGIYYYKCAVTGDMYELVITEQEIFFHDIVRAFFYTFVV